MAALDPYPVAKISAYAGFAAPLLQLLAVDSFTLDVSGPSTRGKTTAAKIGLSVWADPSKKGDGLFSWRTSLIAVEKRLNICRGLPVVIDETHAAEVSSVEIQAGLFDMDGPGIPARTPDAR